MSWDNLSKSFETCKTIHQCAVTHQIGLNVTPNLFGVTFGVICNKEGVTNVDTLLSNHLVIHFSPERENTANTVCHNATSSFKI